MTELLRLLAIYYLCDSTAAIRVMTASEVAACMQTYQAVKARFAVAEPHADPAGAGVRNVRSYARFKAWEAANAALVAQMRQAARARVTASPAPVPADRG